MLGVPLDGARQCAVLRSPPTSVSASALIEWFTGGILLWDDRPFVEIGSDVVRGGADQFDAALVGLIVGPRPLKLGRNE